MKLGKYQLVFWDFDGVIKESVDVKTEAFKELFSTFGQEVVSLVEQHHLQYGGVSRTKKIEYALRNFVGRAPILSEVDDLADRFGTLVREKVVSSPWVPGVESLLRSREHPPYVLVTGTPQNEIEWILSELALESHFERVYGAPIEKSAALRRVLADSNVNPSDGILIGDSRTDYEAARQAGLDFLFRESPHSINQIPDCYTGLRLQDLTSVSIY